MYQRKGELAARILSTFEIKYNFMIYRLSITYRRMDKKTKTLWFIPNNPLANKFTWIVFWSILLYFFVLHELIVWRPLEELCVAICPIRNFCNQLHQLLSDIVAECQRRFVWYLFSLSRQIILKSLLPISREDEKNPPNILSLLLIMIITLWWWWGWLQWWQWWWWWL